MAVSRRMLKRRLAVLCAAALFLLPQPKTLRPKALPPGETRKTAPRILYPASPLLSLRKMEDLQQAAASGQCLSVVAFVTDEGECATRLTDTVDEISATGEFHIHGTFTHDRLRWWEFPPLGTVHQTIRLDPDRDGEQFWRRLKILLAAEPGKSLFLLAVGVGGSKEILDAELFGPLFEKDAELFAELVPEIHQNFHNTVTPRQAEEWLYSPNPWLIWWGLLKLRDQQALTAAHFRSVIERRPAAETHALLYEMLWHGATNPQMRDDMMRELEAILRLPEKQLTALHWLAADLRDKPVDVSRAVDQRRLRDWLIRYKTQDGESLSKEAIKAIDELLEVLHASEQSRSE
jgi:hypothetical protein